MDHDWYDRKPCLYGQMCKAFFEWQHTTILGSGPFRPNPDAEPNSVMEVMQKGYSLNERLVRAAKVIVTKAAES